MENSKIEFLKNQFIPILQQVDARAKGKWGVLNGQQMVEHFSDAVRLASGKTKVPSVTPTEHLPKIRTFMLSDNPFKENTLNPLMNKEGETIKQPSLKDALAELQQELNYFFTAFVNNSSLMTTNPFFGDLNFEENVHLLHKHALHHLNQFGLVH